jgi:fatty-acyl-CoA synthase
MSASNAAPPGSRALSPFIRHLGVRAVEGLATGAGTQVELRPELLNNGHTAHGGLVTTLADSAMAQAAVRACGAEGLVATVDLRISFMGVGNAALRCEAECVHVTASLAFCEAVVRDASGALVARASATFKRTRRPVQK